MTVLRNLLRLLKRSIAVLPCLWQTAFKRCWHTLRIRSGHFKHEEPEYRYLAQWVSTGDCVLDIGANVGVYAAALSELVGPEGHVFAFEPMPETFHLLTFNVRLFPFANVTLVNAAASDTFAFAGMDVPRMDTGLPNLYQAHLTDRDTGSKVFCLPLDALSIPGRVSFVKIDVEGHEMKALTGMENLLRANMPVLVVEGFSADIEKFLADLGYTTVRLHESPNTLFCPPHQGEERAAPSGAASYLSRPE